MASRAPHTIASLGVAFLLAGAFASPAAALMGDTAWATSSIATDVLGPPTSLAATAAIPLTVGLTWTATPDGYAAGYRVYRSTTSGSGYTHVATVTPRTTTTHQDLPLVPGRYYYVVRAYFGAWTSHSSNEVSVLVV